MQAANRAPCKLKPFRNPQTLHPIDLPACCGGQQTSTSFVPRKLLINKQILQFYGTFHANRLKPIPWLPMPDYYALSNSVSIEKLGPGVPFWSF
jgi:hypothetical protein